MGVLLGYTQPNWLQERVAKEGRGSPRATAGSPGLDSCLLSVIPAGRERVRES